MKNFGLIGYPLSHSFSERYFLEKFSTSSIDANYRNFELHDLKVLPEIIELYHLDGFNVTIPYKEKVLSYLNQIDSVAKEIGAVNCVKVSDGNLIGYNTDVIGFEKSLHSFISSSKIKALIFGNGGACLSVKYVLKKMQIPFQVVTRNDVQDTIMYADLTKKIMREYSLLINTTPVGMFPAMNEKLPLPYHLINKTHYAFDLIYNPEKTAFLKNCEAQGAQIKNGYDMLVIQADESYKIFIS